MTTKNLNQLTNERSLYSAQINGILPTVSYLIGRLRDANLQCCPTDVLVIASVGAILACRTEEEVETVVGATSRSLMAEMMKQMFAGDDGKKVVQDLLADIFKDIKAPPLSAEEDTRALDEDPGMDSDGNEEWRSN